MAAKKKPAVAPKKRTPMQAAADKFIAKMDKSYGAGRFNLAEVKPYEIISTGSLTLDDALGLGGYVEGRTYEVWGPESAGKTTLTIKGIIEAQKKYPDRMCAFIDVEKRADTKWFRDHGVDLDRLMIVRPDTAEEVADLLKDTIEELAPGSDTMGLFSFIVLDSIGAMLPKKQMEKNADEATVGDHAKLVTRMVKMANVKAADRGCVVIFINQVRAAIGSYGADTTTPGGFALKHGTTGKLHVRRSSGGALAVGKDQVGHLTTVKVERNSVAKAYRSAEYALLYVDTDKYGPMGIDIALEAAHIGKNSGVISLAGAWYTNTLTGERFNGWEKLVSNFRANPEQSLAIRDAVVAQNEGGYVTVIDSEGEVRVLDEDGEVIAEEDDQEVISEAQAIINRATLTSVEDDG